MYLNAGKYKTRGKNDGLQNLQEKKVFPETSVHHGGLGLLQRPK